MDIEKIKEQYFVQLLEYFLKKYRKINIIKTEAYKLPSFFDETCSFKGIGCKMDKHWNFCSCGCGQVDLYCEIGFSSQKTLFRENNINGEWERWIHPRIEEMLRIEVSVSGEEITIKEK